MASLVMYCPDMIHEYGHGNAVAVKLTESVVKAKLAPTYAEGAVVLTNWSKLIKQNYYDKKNSLVPCSTDATML